MWTYKQSSGELIKSDGEIIGSGYSGGGTDPTNLEAIQGHNNPLLQSVHNVGPIPVGFYTIEVPVNSLIHGLYVLPLSPNTSNNMYGRSGFLIHGASISHPNYASNGCIIISRLIREAIWASNDRLLEVIS